MARRDETRRGEWSRRPIDNKDMICNWYFVVKKSIDLNGNLMVADFSWLALSAEQSSQPAISSGTISSSLSRRSEIKDCILGLFGKQSERASMEIWAECDKNNLIRYSVWTRWDLSRIFVSLGLDWTPGGGLKWPHYVKEITERTCCCLPEFALLSFWVGTKRTNFPSPSTKPAIHPAS